MIQYAFVLISRLFEISDIRVNHQYDKKKTLLSTDFKDKILMKVFKVNRVPVVPMSHRPCVITCQLTLIKSKLMKLRAHNCFFFLSLHITPQ